MVGLLVAAAAMAGSQDVADGFAVGAATVGGQLALGIGGAAVGSAWGSAMCKGVPADHHCLAPVVMAFPIAGLGIIVGAPIGAGVGSLATDRNPWRSVAFVGATQLGALALAAGGLAIINAGDTGALAGTGMLLTAGIGAVVAPPIVAGLGAATGPDDFHVAVLPELGRDQAGVRIVAAF